MKSMLTSRGAEIEVDADVKGVLKLKLRLTSWRFQGNEVDDDVKEGLKLKLMLTSRRV